MTPGEPMTAEFEFGLVPVDPISQATEKVADALDGFHGLTEKLFDRREKQIDRAIKVAGTIGQSIDEFSNKLKALDQAIESLRLETSDSATRITGAIDRINVG
jgi:hypothetical protein